MSSKGKVNTGTVRGLGFFCYFIRCGFLFCFWLPVTSFLSLKIKRIDKDLGLCYLSSFETMLAFLNGSTQVFFFPSWRVLQPQDRHWSVHESTKSNGERAANQTLIVKFGMLHIVTMQVISMWQAERTIRKNLLITLGIFKFFGSTATAFPTY